MLTAAEFKPYLEVLGIRADHPGMFDLGYIARIRAHERVSLLNLARKEGVLEADLPKAMWPVEADKGQISQVIQNIVINATQAMVSKPYGIDSLATALSQVVGRA